jgi:glucose-6-phosphate isomerase
MKLNVNAVDLEFNEDERKLFADGNEVPFSVRSVGEMKDVIFNKEFITPKNKNDIIYRMYRGAGVDKNSTVFSAHNIRYDVTVIENYDLGGEFTKTLGHYHPIVRNGLAYPELYEIISGEAVYLLQKKNEDGSFDLQLVHAKKGDKVIMPPNYGHFSINIGSGLLIEANLVNSTFDSDYKSVQKMGGGAIFLLRNGNAVLNRGYRETTLKHGDAEKIPFLDYSKSIYDEYISHPEHFIFLNKPEFLFSKHDQWDIETQNF